MHSKMFVADNALAVIGGRNQVTPTSTPPTTATFVDLDVLTGGPVVKDLSRSFDRWNNVRARFNHWSAKLITATQEPV